MIYLDNAATTFPKPKPVYDAMKNSLMKYGANPGRSGHKMSVETAKMVYNTRESISNMFGAQVENVIFTGNCTSALNMAIKGILKKGDHIIISDMEHNSVLRPVHNLYENGLVTYSVAEVVEGDFDATVKNFRNLINENTKMIACTHGSNLTGTVLPIEKLGKLCSEKRIYFLVDAAQSAGVIPINMSETGIDFLCMPGHKGLYGPPGTGILIAEKPDAIVPTIHGGTGNLSLSFSQPYNMPEKLESGTLNTPGIISLGKGIEYINKTGINKIYKYETELASKLYENLRGMRKVKLYTKPPKLGYNLPVICFNIEGYYSEETTEYLSSKGFCVRGGFHCAALTHNKLGTIQTGAVRASFASFNTSEQVRKFSQTIHLLTKN